MDYNNLLPYVDQDQLVPVQGLLIKLPTRCQKCDERCKKFYKSLISEKDGFYQCSAGYSIYKSDKVFYIGLKVSGHFDKEKTKNSSMKEESSGIKEMNPVFSELFIKNLCCMSTINNAEMKRYERLFTETKGMLHETEMLNNNAVASIDQLINYVEDYKHGHKLRAKDIEGLKQCSRNIWAATNTIRVRYALFSFNLNPDRVVDNKAGANIFGRFNKAAKCIKQDCENKFLKVILDNKGRQNLTARVGEFFDIIPYVLFSNAVKYSPERRSIEVVFSENTTHIKINIKSIGPYMEKDEIEHVFESGYRGANARKWEKNGQGIGLAVVKRIADISGHSLHVESVDIFEKERGIPLGQFCLTLEISKNP